MSEFNIGETAVLICLYRIIHYAGRSEFITITKSPITRSPDFSFLTVSPVQVFEITFDAMRNLLAFPDESRIWVYQADRPFDDADIMAVNEDIDHFCRQWTSHNNDLRAIGGVMHDQFVVLVADETHASASGCSIDKSVAFIKSLEQKYGRSLLERTNVAWMDEQEQIHTMPLTDLKGAVASGRINENTPVFDNLVSNRKEYLSRWVAPLKDTWMKRFA